MVRLQGVGWFAGLVFLSTLGSAGGELRLYRVLCLGWWKTVGMLMGEDGVIEEYL